MMPVLIRPVPPTISACNMLRAYHTRRPGSQGRHPHPPVEMRPCRLFRAPLFAVPYRVPITTSFDARAPAVIVTFTGTITFADFDAARKTVSSEPGWSPQCPHILDFTGVVALELSSEDIQKLAAAPPIFDPSALQILVARRGSVHFGLSRMFQTYADGKRKVHVVDSIERAMGLLVGPNADNRTRR
ncbi:MAG: hypothetical protein ACRENE_23740 [Polyangiaceae bacterium]